MTALETQLADNKARMVAAYRLGDWESVKKCSAEKERLKRRRRPGCLTCGVPLSGGGAGHPHRYCIMHRLRNRLAPIAAALALVSSAAAYQLTLGWDLSTDPTVTGFRLYYGTASGNLTNSVDAQGTNLVTVTGLAAGVTNYFAVTAYTATGAESDLSPEISFATNAPPSAVITLSLSLDTSSDLTTWSAATNIALFSVTNPPSPQFWRGRLNVIRQ